MAPPAMDTYEIVAAFVLTWAADARLSRPEEERACARRLVGHTSQMSHGSGLMGSVGVSIRLEHTHEGVSYLRRARARLRRRLAIWLTTVTTVGHVLAG